MRTLAWLGLAVHPSKRAGRSRAQLILHSSIRGKSYHFPCEAMPIPQVVRSRLVVSSSPKKKVAGQESGLGWECMTSRQPRNRAHAPFNSPERQAIRAVCTREPPLPIYLCSQDSFMWDFRLTQSSVPPFQAHSRTVTS